MTGVAVVVGPADVVGGREIDAELVTAAIESAADEVALVDDRVMPVAAVWRAVLAAAVEPGTRRLTVVCPTWWPASRLDVVRAAGHHVATDVVVRRRADVVRGSRTAVIVEIAADFVLVHHAAATPAVVPRVGDPCPAVVARVGDVEAAVVDVPGGLSGAARLGDGVVRALSRRGVVVSTTDDRWVQRAAVGSGRRRPTGARTGHARLAAVAGAGLVAALAGVAVGTGADDAAVPAPVWLVEGRVAVEVPAGWPVERIVSGPGSARVQVLSPSEPHVAIHLTQSPAQASPHAAAEVLRAALDDQPAGVFVAFAPADRRAGRDAITYREVRPAYQVDWAVLLDRGVRIAIGCQHAPDGPIPDRVCDQAVRSARALV